MTQDHSLAGPVGGLPPNLRLYLDHACHGISLREIARREGVAASTVMRRVRRIETRRDDPLLDAALRAFESRTPAQRAARPEAGASRPALDCGRRPCAPVPRETTPPDEETVMQAPRHSEDPSVPFPQEAEVQRVLRRLNEPQAVMAIAADLAKAVVLRRMPDGTSARTAILDRSLAEAFVLRDWISLTAPGRPATYEITAAGRAALKRLMTEAALQQPGLAEEASAFAGQHRIWAEKTVPGAAGEAARRLRYNLAESPVAALGRRRDKDGVPFLTPELVEAGERLREDFELAQMGPRIAQNWERFLTGPSRGGFASARMLEGGSSAARERVARALGDLGPGLGDMVLRCCCHLEGLETAEKRLGWSARSGKVVLRIALDRLKRHYAESYGRGSPLIG